MLARRLVAELGRCECPSAADAPKSTLRALRYLAFLPDVSCPSPLGRSLRAISATGSLMCRPVSFPPGCRRVTCVFRASSCSSPAARRLLRFPRRMKKGTVPFSITRQPGGPMQISESQLKLVNDQVQRLVASGNYFGRRLQEAGVTEVRTPADFLALPFSEKQDLRECYPLGLAAVPERQIVRIHSSSGTTGTPVIIPYTAKDVDDWAEQFRRCYEMAGVTPDDRVQITPGYGLWTAGIGFQAGAERAGRYGHPHGPRQHREAAAVHDRHAHHRARRHLQLRAAARRGDRAPRPGRQDLPAQGHHRLGALGREDAQPDSRASWASRSTTSTASPRSTAPASASRATTTAACTTGTTISIWRSLTPRPASPCPTGSLARSSSPRSSRRARRSCASARTTSAASSPGRARAARRSRASTPSRAAPTT